MPLGNSPLRVAITGGTGFVGSHVARALADSGHDVVTISRGTRRRPKRRGTTFVRADVAKQDALERAFRGVDGVLNLVAMLKQRRGRTFNAVNRDGTSIAARAAKAAGVSHFIQMSALGADANPAYPYLKSKWDGEQAVRTAGIPFSILRPSTMFGPGDGFFTSLVRVARLSIPPVPLVIPGDGQTLFQPIA